MGLNKNLRVALCFTAIAFILIFIAFVSPYWLVFDGQLKEPKFLNLGLWTVCFKNFTDIHRFYDTQFQGCMWVFEEEYYIIHDFLLPGFYTAVQFFFTLTFTLLLISGILICGIFIYTPDEDKYMTVLLSNGACQVAGAIFGLIAVITFGARGDGRDWMPHWEHNNMGWAYACACVGVCVLLPSGALFITEARRRKYKKLNEIGTRETSAYSVGEDIRRYTQRQQQGHTDI